MVRISTVCILFASIVGLVSAANPDDMKLPSIELCRDAGNKFRNWKRLQLLSDLSKKDQDNSKQEASQILAQKANIEFIQANKLAEAAMKADVNAICKEQASIIEKYDEIHKQEYNLNVDYEWEEVEKKYNKEYGPYIKMLELIKRECRTITNIDTPKKMIQEKSRSAIKKATDKSRSMFRKLIDSKAANTNERQ